MRSFTVLYSCVFLSSFNFSISSINIAYTVVGRNGIRAGVGDTVINDPVLTSDTGSIDIHLTAGWPRSNTYINSVITDNGWRRVDLRVSGVVPGAPNSAADSPVEGRGFVWINGSQSNTFTGTLFVNNANCVVLNKTNGATAVRGNIVASNGGVVGLERSNQIADTSTVTLDGRIRAAGLHFEVIGYDISEKFHQLRVMGRGSLSLFTDYFRKLYLDDLMIDWGSELLVKGYNAELTFLLVRKDSKHLQDALHRVKFQGRREPKASIKDYDANYWQVIPGFPEPATYGAAFSVAAVGLWACRRKQRVPARGSS